MKWIVSERTMSTAWPSTYICNLWCCTSLFGSTSYRDESTTHLSNPPKRLSIESWIDEIVKENTAIRGSISNRGRRSLNENRPSKDRILYWMSQESISSPSQDGVRYPHYPSVELIVKVCLVDLRPSTGEEDEDEASCISAIQSSREAAGAKIFGDFQPVI